MVSEAIDATSMETNAGLGDAPARMLELIRKVRILGRSATIPEARLSGRACNLSEDIIALRTEPTKLVALLRMPLCA
jgi:hypothetical protein